MYETKIQTKIFETQRIIDGFLQILRENNNESGFNICKEKELVGYYKRLNNIIKSMERMDPPWEFRTAHPGIILVLTNYRSAIMELLNYCHDKEEKHLEVMLNLLEQGYQLMEENGEHLSKMNPEDGKLREERFKNRCFIATAAYGDFNAPEVISFRNFRDDYLLQRKWGQIFVRIYYKKSPSIAVFLEKHSKLSLQVRLMLDNILKCINWNNKY